jgi:bifunctional non-homologous end joining protein LigD
MPPRKIAHKTAARKQTKNTKETSTSAAAAIDEQLARYRSMRDFEVTKEPSGGSKGNGNRAGKLPFVIQKHAATRLHYDFRLGWNGVLKSWAIAKGPSYVTKDKRLAVQVEDHPIEYGGFEGVIPHGQYGGGTVLLWDEGTWEPQPGHEDVDAGLRDGALKFVLHGEKMRGKWALIRMSGAAAQKASKPNWLLIKEHDEFERDARAKAIVDESPDSVATGRGMDEIARDSDHVWNSNETAAKNAASTLASRQDRSSAHRTSKYASKADTRGIESALKNKPREELPDFIAPQLAVQAAEATDADGWIHELKLDGYRIQAICKAGRVQLRTRNQLDWTRRMQPLAAELAKLPAAQAVLDGELVVLDEHGLSSFARLQAAFQDAASHPLTYFVFDLLHLNGRSLRDTPLVERKALLQSLIDSAGGGKEHIQISEHIEGKGAATFANACRLQAEGIVSKRAAGVYKPGRSADWVKVKCRREQEFVIGGFTLPGNGSHGVGALLLGYYDDRDRLIYAGRTGTGFTQSLHHSLRDRLDKLLSNKNPFERVGNREQRGVIWVKPVLVAQVEFATWTSDLLVRQAAFKGLREDKPAKEVRREEPEEKKGQPASKGARAAAGQSATQRAVPRTAAKSLSAGLGKYSGKRSSPPSPTSPPSPPSRRSQRLTHPGKVVDAESGLTKQQLADYYAAVADVLLPEIAGRPLSLVRCPAGADKPCFFQKHSSDTLPEAIQTVEVPDKKTGQLEPYITLDAPEGLESLAQIGVLEVHPWGSRNADLEHPDRIIFDLDPDEAISWKTLAASAVEIRNLLKKHGLVSFLKSTGGKGLHIVIPIVPRYDWQVVKDFAHSIAAELEKKNPSLYVLNMSKAARKGKIFLDYLRNDRGATAVAAYSPRARKGAPASVPLQWKELETAERPTFHVADFERWRVRLKNPEWTKIYSTRQELKINGSAG